MRHATPALWNLKRIEDLLDLERLDDLLFINRCYEPNRSGHAFGGQLIGQSLVAATRTVTERDLHALQLLFIAPASCDEPIEYFVTKIRDGRNFSYRRVTAIQQGKELLSLTASFHANASSFEHQAVERPKRPDPDRLVSFDVAARRSFQSVDEVTRRRFLSPHPIESRPVNPEDLLRRKAEKARMSIWVRPRTRLSDEPGMHACVLGYVSDWLPPFTSVITHVDSMLNLDFFQSSLNHVMWMHRPIVFDDWLLCEADSPIAFAGRGLSHAHYFDRNGNLVASMVQENLLQQRLPRGSPASSIG